MQVCSAFIDVAGTRSTLLCNLNIVEDSPPASPVARAQVELTGGGLSVPASTRAGIPYKTCIDRPYVQKEEQRSQYKRELHTYQCGWGGNPRTHNCMLSIDPALFAC